MTNHAVCNPLPKAEAWRNLKDHNDGFSMEIVHETASAKINIYLEILGRRSDGFHNLETVFQSIALHDSVRISASGDTLTLHGADDIGPAEQNLCIQAAQAWFACSGLPPACTIHLEKRIPHGAGLGGGSSDAAAVLRGLQALHPGYVSNNQLADIALTLGSDVPFFLHGGRCHATGRGEVLTPLPESAMQPITLFMPPTHQATPAVFKALNENERGPRNSHGPSFFTTQTDWGFNRLSGPARRINPLIAQTLDALSHCLLF